jgi:hypothetical protein
MCSPLTAQYGEILLAVIIHKSVKRGDTDRRGAVNEKEAT